MADITLKGAPFHTVSELPKVGSKAKDFTLTRDNLSEINLQSLAGKTVVLNIFPSLDTPTCATAMKEFNQIANEKPDLTVLCVSADLPFAQKRFCSMENLTSVMPVSNFRHPDFGKLYGVEISDGPLMGLLARAVVVIDKNGNVSYNQLVNEIADEPDYADLIKHIS